MRFHRNVKMLRGQLDAAPFITVFFLVLIFVLIGTLVYTPGVRLNLPVADDLAGVDSPSVSVAIDPQGRLYYENQMIAEAELLRRLSQAVSAAPAPLTLIIHADRDVSYNQLVQLTLLARNAGVKEALLATLPRLFPQAGDTSTLSP